MAISNVTVVPLELKRWDIDYEKDEVARKNHFDKQVFSTRQNVNEGKK